MKDKIAILTGAAGGVGAATAKMLDEEGVLLALVDINSAGLDELAKSLGKEPLCIEADITSMDETRRIYDETIERFGRVDILINNAGVVSTKPYEDRDMDDIEREMDINYTAAARLIRQVIPHMKERGSGNIVTVCSLAGILPLRESPVYVASKFALRGLMISLHLSLKEHGIGVTNICPTAVDTPLLLQETKDGGSLLNFLADPLPASDVAKAVIKGISTGVVEICVPWSEGVGCKLLGFMPSLISPMAPILEKMGRKRHDKYLKKQKERQ